MLQTHTIWGHGLLEDRDDPPKERKSELKSEDEKVKGGGEAQSQAEALGKEGTGWDTSTRGVAETGERALRKAWLRTAGPEPADGSWEEFWPGC